MAILTGTGVSHHRNPVRAAEEAVGLACARAGCSDPDFVLLFATTAYDQAALLKAVREATHGATLAGCSAPGVITQGEGDEGFFSVGVTVVKSPDLRFVSASAEALKETSTQAGQAIGATIGPHLTDDALTMLVFVDGVTCNFERFRQGFDASMGKTDAVMMLGGAAGDSWTMQKSFQYHDDRVLTDGAVAVLVSGRGRIVSAISHGCVPIGQERKVTRSKANVIYEIDHKPVMEVIKEYLEDQDIANWPTATVTLGWGFRAPENIRDVYGEYLIRAMPPKRDPHDDFIILPSEVEEGSSIWMTRRDQDRLEAGITTVARELSQALEGRSPRVVFQFDCLGRGNMLFGQQKKTTLLRSLQQSVAPDAPWTGFYSFGEIGPVAGKNHFHNFTLVLAALAEA